MSGRPIPWLVAAAVALSAAVGTVAAGPATDRLLRSQLGDPTLDQVLDQQGTELQAQLMTVDPLGDGLIVSYEYVLEGDLYVGYQRMPRDARPGVPMDWVTIDAIADARGASRLRGTRRAPGSHIVTWWARWWPARWALAALWGVCACGAGGRAWRALREGAAT